MAGLISDLGNIASLTNSTLIEVEEGLASYNATFAQILSYIASYRPFPRGHIDGLICSNAADPDHDITIGIGECIDSTQTYLLELASAITKQIDAAWAPGNNAGGIDTGAVAANKVYYVFLIRKDSDGSIDALFSLSATAPTMPAGYTYKRRIGTVVIDSISRIRGFIQIGDKFIYKQLVINQAYVALASTDRTAYALSAPRNMEAIVRATMLWNGTVSDVFMWFDSESKPDVQSSITNFDLYVHNQNGTGSVIKNIKTNAARQIFARGVSTSIYIDISTLGWIDNRGRDA